MAVSDPSEEGSGPDIYRVLGINGQRFQELL